MDTKAQTENELNTEVLHDLLSKGTPKSIIAQEMGVTVRQLTKTIAELQTGQGLILKYRELQGIQLTAIQSQILDAITPDKIECASLVELVSAFKVLKDKELVMGGKANNITGIVGYLVELEKEEALKKAPIIDVTEYAEYTEAPVVETAVEDILPNL